MLYKHAYVSHIQQSYNKQFISCVKAIVFADINLKVQSKAAELKISMGCRAKQPLRVCRTVTEPGGGSEKWLYRF